ncbi:hypothetical protein ACFFHM_20635 [Halalkalibacter kiskunsagensis]|uniref:Uncharacterized protein n=1 Tax=Halalkalibacter kiskunsagensis TaxID=1548599 RepID=A0ABV6KHP4_9BACI
METMRVLQYVCSFLGTSCLIFTYIQMAKNDRKKDKIAKGADTD